MRDGGTLRVSLLQVAYDEREDTRARIERVLALIGSERNSDLIVLPELWGCGAFTPGVWAERAEGLDGRTAALLSAAARENGCFLHAGSIIERSAENGDRGPEDRGLWNTSLVFGPDGGRLASYRKIHRFGFGEGEPQLLEAGSVPTTVTLPQGTAGLATCYDLRFPELFRSLVDLGSTFFVVPAAWPAARIEHWELLGRARALENQAFVIQCNTVGTHGGLRMGGRSQVCDPQGQVVAQAGDDETTLAVNIDLDRVCEFRSAFPVLDDRRVCAR